MKSNIPKENVNILIKFRVWRKSDWKRGGEGEGRQQQRTAGVSPRAQEPLRSALFWAGLLEGGAVHFDSSIGRPGLDQQQRSGVRKYHASRGNICGLSQTVGFSLGVW